MIFYITQRNKLSTKRSTAVSRFNAGPRHAFVAGDPVGLSVAVDRKGPVYMLANERRGMTGAPLQGHDHLRCGGCVAQSYGNVAQPALVTDTSDGRAFGVGQKRRLVPCE